MGSTSAVGARERSTAEAGHRKLHERGGAVKSTRKARRTGDAIAALVQGEAETVIGGVREADLVSHRAHDVLGGGTCVRVVARPWGEWTFVTNLHGAARLQQERLHAVVQEVDLTYDLAPHFLDRACGVHAGQSLRQREKTLRQVRQATNKRQKVAGHGTRGRPKTTVVGQSRATHDQPGGSTQPHTGGNERRGTFGAATKTCMERGGGGRPFHMHTLPLSPQSLSLRTHADTRRHTLARPGMHRTGTNRQRYGNWTALAPSQSSSPRRTVHTLTHARTPTPLHTYIGGAVRLGRGQAVRVNQTRSKPVKPLQISLHVLPGGGDS